MCLLLQHKKSFGLFTSRRSVKEVEGRSRNLLVSAQEYVEYHSQHLVMAVHKLDNLLMRKYQRVSVFVCVYVCAHMWEYLVCEALRHFIIKTSRFQDKNFKCNIYVCVRVCMHVCICGHICIIHVLYAHML